ncbi:hypothetical protein FLAVO9R_50047 [Flavobacterium sp. 9R]|nr:hypothetical protein FLAVO9R_50047 [Flavobacterium sp. 9R]
MVASCYPSRGQSQELTAPPQQTVIDKLAMNISENIYIFSRKKDIFGMTKTQDQRE